MTPQHRYQILQSIPRAMVCGHCLYLTDGTIIWNGSTDGIVFLSSDGRIPDCTNDPEIYSAIKEALMPIEEGIAKRDAIKTTVKYHRTAIVRRLEDCGYDVRGGGYGGDWREYQAFDVTESPDEKLKGEIQFISLTKVTTIEEPL